jgi:hypothetical protein
LDLGFAGATAIELSGCGSPEAFGVVADTTGPASVEAAFAGLGERWNGELNLDIVRRLGNGKADYRWAKSQATQHAPLVRWRR